MSFDPTWLFLSLIPSGVGFVLFVHGRKQERWLHVVAGVLFMVYPYFSTSVASLVGIGLVLAGGLWYATRAGW